MPSYFFDTSALVKRYHPEAGTSIVDQIFADASDTVYISRIGLVEIISAFVQKVRSGVISDSDSEEYRRLVMRDIRQRRVRVVRMLVRHLHLSDQMLQNYGATYRLRTLDAIQIAVAADFQALANPLTFVCADQELCKVARMAGFAIVNPIATVH